MAINFEIFGIPCLIHVGIASLCTVHLVKCVGRGDAMNNRFSSARAVQCPGKTFWGSRKVLKSAGIFSKQEGGNHVSSVCIFAFDCQLPVKSIVRNDSSAK